MLSNFTNKYQLSKTLRFELKPVGETLKFIEQKGLLSQDETRSEEYKVAKEVIDEYHKEFIHQSLQGVRLSKIDEYERFYLMQNREDSEDIEFEKIKTDLRGQIVKAFESHQKYKTIDKKELFKEDLPAFIEENEAWSSEEKSEYQKVIKNFSQFTTYFTGFHENRKNIYSKDAKHSSIGYRVIHENLPIFLTNKRAFEAINRQFPQIATDTQNSLTEHLQGAVVADMFSLDYFSLTLAQIYIDLYNTMLGGKTLEDGTKIQGLNELINLYRQQNNIDKRTLPNLKPLHKQILSDREKLSWLPEEFASKEEINIAIDSFYQQNIINFRCCDGVVDITEKFIEIFSQNSHYDTNMIFVKNDLSLTSISQDIFKDYKVIKEALWQNHLRDNPRANRSKDIAADEEKFFNKKNSYFSFANILNALESADKKVDCLGEEVNLFGYFATGVKKLAKQIKESYKSWNSDQNDKKRTKEFLDLMLDLQRALKPLVVKTEIDKDIAFYAMFDTYFESLNKIVKLYDMVRNFESKKPYSIEKFKLNFENSTLLDGWDVNKETDNTSVLLIKDKLFYLAVMDKKHNKVFSKLSKTNTSNCYQKVDYKLLPGANKMLPKVFFSNKNIDFYKPSTRLLESYRNGEHKKGEMFNIEFCHELIDFFKASIAKHPDWQYFDFDFSLTSTYEDMSDFYKEVEQQGYKITFRDIDSSYIDELINDGKIYLFQIYNKDFSPYSKGTPNMHTLYWRALFDKENLKDVIYKLNGQAEIFYRKKSIEYSQEIWQKGHHYELLKDKFDYPIVKDRRFALDKFAFHVPIAINFKAVGKDNLNEVVNEFVKENHKDIKVIGIDRGERHLLYLTLVDSDGKIVEQYSLNEITNHYNGKEYPVNYHERLDKKEKERANARENWGVVENIKELKEGYLSQVVHKVAKLMVEHNAIVALEDLNFGFKRGRFKVEKQVYQKFEKALIEKLNYLVDKKKNRNELGGLFRALQLTGKFTSFEKLGKQSGFLYYIPAWNTSKIDPTTGFVNLLDTRYQSIDKSKEFFAKFDDIRFNEKANYFEFSFDYNNFTQKAEGTRTKWTICTYGTRIATTRNEEKNHQWDSNEIDLTDEFKKFFGSRKDGLKEFIVSQENKEFFAKLFYLLKLTLQMRNSIANSDIDYLISPVQNASGGFFDSRAASKNLPKDADANGAYNIARKGLMLIDKIKNSPDIKKIDMRITNKEWLSFVQK